LETHELRVLTGNKSGALLLHISCSVLCCRPESVHRPSRYRQADDVRSGSVNIIIIMI